LSRRLSVRRAPFSPLWPPPSFAFSSTIYLPAYRRRCAGRLAAEGHAFSFFTRNLVRLAPDLVALLQQCDQAIDPNLLQLAAAHEKIVAEVGEGAAAEAFAKAEGEEAEGEDTA
jgi:ATP-dependent RNA helicase DDX5/DBP2